MRQHFIPQFLIKGFVKYGALFRLEKNGPERTPKPVTPKNLFLQNDYYTLRSGMADERYEVEKQLSKLEGRAAPIVQRMIGDVRNGRNEIAIRPKEKATLCNFFSTLYSRNPKTGDTAATRIRDRGLTTTAAQETEARDLQRLSIFWPNRSQKEMESMGMSLYHINEDPTQCYILGDMPVTAHPNPCPNPRAPTKEWLLLAPISYDVCLSLSTGYAESKIVGIGQADTQMTKDVNEWIYRQSWKAVAGCSREILLELAESDARPT